jgi:hypothetical protein
MLELTAELTIFANAENTKTKNAKINKPCNTPKIISQSVILIYARLPETHFAELVQKLV